MAKTKEKEKTAKLEVPKSRLREHYRDTVLPALMKEFDYTTPMQAPRVTKIVVNMGVGDAIKDGKLLDNSVRDLKTITGQSPPPTGASTSW